MSNTDALKELVQKGAAACAEAEEYLERAREKILALQSFPAEGRTLGMIGYLESQALKSQILAMAGMVADTESKLYTMHRRATDIAQEHGVDLPATRDGGGDR